MVYFLAGPYQAQVRMEEIPLNDETFFQLYQYHQAFVVMNLVGLALPILRYVEGLVTIPKKQKSKDQ